MHEDIENLDAGLSLAIRRAAERQGSEARAVSWLQSDAQTDIHAVLRLGNAATLDVERKHAQAKKAEGYRLSLVSSASRDLIMRRYRAQREKLRMDRAREAKKRKRAAKGLLLSFPRAAKMDPGPAAEARGGRSPSGPPWRKG